MFQVTKVVIRLSLNHTKLYKVTVHIGITVGLQGYYYSNVYHIWYG